MDTGIVVAGLAAAGVIGSSAIQWKSNRDSIRANEARELKQRDAESFRMHAQYAQELAVRAAEHSEREESAAAEFQRTHEAAERAKTAAAHKAALRALDTFRMHAAALPLGPYDNLEAWESLLVRSLESVDVSRADLLFESPDGGVVTAFLNARDSCSYILERAKTWRTDMSESTEIKESWPENARQLDAKIHEYWLATGRVHGW